VPYLIHDEDRSIRQEDGIQRSPLGEARAILDVSDIDEGSRIALVGSPRRLEPPGAH
jgi:hypothetical protein